MKPALKFDDGETYARLMDEILAVNNVAFAAKGKMPDHLHTRLESAGRKAQRILTEEVK